MNVMSQKEYISLLSRHLFWDMDVNKVNLDTCPAQIIQRVLEIWQFKRLATYIIILWIG